MIVPLGVVLAECVESVPDESAWEHSAREKSKQSRVLFKSENSFHIVFSIYCGTANHK